MNLLDMPVVVFVSWKILENSINHLAMFPEMGVRGKVANTRELYHNRYRIVYEIKSNIVIIKTVIHCSKLYP
ncbi:MULTISPECIES: type II toxin-antitoxin system RelE/ParE family toxin [unclassified Mannheimia]|uniref:type II toxin-antitoxin system RelE/ParE family toxin n=1 Tax=unclassified Mannheimia TaxID=2645054 RepID=UPI00359ECBCE